MSCGLWACPSLARALGTGHWVPGTSTGLSWVLRLVGVQEGQGAPCTTLGLLLN